MDTIDTRGGCAVHNRAAAAAGCLAAGGMSSSSCAARERERDGAVRVALPQSSRPTAALRRSAITARLHESGFAERVACSRAPPTSQPVCLSACLRHFQLRSIVRRRASPGPRTASLWTTLIEFSGPGPGPIRSDPIGNDRRTAERCRCWIGARLHERASSNAISRIPLRPPKHYRTQHLLCWDSTISRCRIQVTCRDAQE